METLKRWALLILILVSLAMTAAAAVDRCAICGQEINGTVYLFTDGVTGEKQMICGDCARLPRCFICSLPVKDDGVALPDGRHLCARDKRTAVLTANEARQVADEVQGRLDRLFARFTSFPTNVDVTVLDRIDVDQMFQPGGNDFESPNLLGCIQAKTDAGQKRYSMRLMTGLPLAELQATAAHEFSHAWVGDNVSPRRRSALSRNAEEGFCELVAYLLMDSQNEEGQKKFILKNFYTRGQVQLFIEANERYGFDQILDWMKYGDTPELESGRLDKVRDVTMPPPASMTASRPAVKDTSGANSSEPKAPVLTAVPSQGMSAPLAAQAPETIKVQGIFWGKSPSAIINGHSVFPDDRFKLTIGGKTLNLHCLEIRKDAVQIENMDTGVKEDLPF
jgi:hypothetical protein